MPIASSVAAFTLINLASKFQEFFYGDAADVTFEYMNEDGEVLSTTVPNVAKVTAELQENGVTDSELDDILKEYYKQGEVDELNDAIIAKFDDYYTKNQVDDAIKVVDDRVTSTNVTVTTNKELAHKETMDVDSTNVMSKAQFEALAAMNREKFAGSGFISLFNDGYNRLDYLNYGGMYTWRHADVYLYSKDSSNCHPNIKPRGSYLYLNIDPSQEGNYFNINGYKILLKNTTFPIQFSGIDLPNNPVPPVIKDSTNAPAMKQGDMAVLADFDRELFDVKDINLVEVGDADGNATVSITDDIYEFETTNGSHYMLFDYFDYIGDQDAVYEITFKVKSDDFTKGMIRTYNGTFHNDTEYAITSEYVEHKIEFKPDGKERLYLLSNTGETGKVYFDVTSVKLKKETPIVALRYTNVGDVYENAPKFEARDSVSRQDLVFLELTTRYAA